MALLFCSENSTILYFMIFKQAKNIPLIVSGFVGVILIVN